jgi:hypothetical protein
MWHAMFNPELPMEYLELTEPAKGGHQFILCRKTAKGAPIRMQIQDYSPTNPLPQKCCPVCLETLTQRAVMKRLGVA